MASKTLAVFVAVATIVTVYCGWLPDQVHECTKGCPNGFFSHQDSCYVIPRVKVTWGQAVGYCRALDAELLIIETKDEQEFLEKEMEKHHGDKFWFAATDIIVEGKWRWAVTMSPVIATAWAEGQPDDIVEPGRTYGQHCAAISHAKWFDENCSTKLFAICERALV